MTQSQPSKNKRLSLDPGKQKLRTIQKLNTTQFDMKKRQQVSQSLIMNEGYVQKDVLCDVLQLTRAFQAISKDGNRIDASCLEYFLDQQGEGRYRAVQMIALLDREKRGYVTMEEFMDFFEKGLYDIPPALDEQTSTNKQWVKTIDEHYDELQSYQSKHYCQYAAEKIKQYKSQIHL